jgi:hypothetical protein
LFCSLPLLIDVVDCKEMGGYVCKWATGEELLACLGKPVKPVEDVVFVVLSQDMFSGSKLQELVVNLPIYFQALLARVPRTLYRSLHSETGPYKSTSDAVLIQ